MATNKNYSNGSFISAAKSIAFSAASLLGQNKCVKCIIDDDNHFELTSDVLKLLQIIKVDHPAISIIYDVCKGFHKIYGTGCSTLVFMMGAWLQSLEILIDEGVPLTLATNLFDEAVRVCTEEATRCSISIDDLIQLSNKNGPGFDGKISSCQTLHTSDSKAVHSERKSLRSTSPTGGTVNKNFPSNVFGSGFINNKKTNIARERALKFTNRYSRHLTETDAAEKQEQNQCILKKKIHIISHCVSRGNRVVEKLLIKLLELIKEAKKHVENLKGLGFTLDNVFIEFIDGKSESESDVFEGICVTANSVDVQDKCHSIEHQHIKVCLVDFDKTKHCKTTMKNEIDDSVDSCVKKLKLLGIQCVIYNGDNNTFKEIRGSKEIIALKVGSIKHLYSISMATGNPIVSSIHELESEDIKMPIRLSCVGHIHEPVGRGREAHRVRPVISVQFSESEEKYFTVLICGVTANMSTLLEEKLWTSLNRLKNIIDTGKYLTGCGWIEKKCAEKLLSYTEQQSCQLPWHCKRYENSLMQQEANLYRRKVFSEVAKGFMKYCSKLSQEGDQLETRNACHQLIDDLQSKCEAWKRAVRLVNLISRIDIVITKA